MDIYSLAMIFGTGLSLLKTDSLSFPPKVDNPPLIKVSNKNMVTGKNIVLDSIGLIEQYGYTAQKHTVITPDGYKIDVFRISSSPKYSGLMNKTSVYLSHGLFGSSDYWLMRGPEYDLAFMLADIGCDVWLGNVRGNSYGRKHENLNPDRDEQFWKYSYHEIGLLDVSTIIDHILQTTQKSSLIYVGHSQGASSVFALLSMKPSYNSKIKLLISLAPPIILDDEFYPPITKLGLQNVDTVKAFLESSRIYELFPQSAWNMLLSGQICAEGSILQPLCFAVYFQLFGKSMTELDTKLVQVAVKYYPSGASTQCVYHYSQNINEGTFRAYDYKDRELNLKKYGLERAPFYNVSKVTAPNAIFYSEADIFIPPRNVRKLKKLLQNIVLFKRIDEDDFGHVDFVVARNVKKLVNQPVIDVIHQYM